MENELKRGASHIYRALLKNGHSNFSITILEYCEPEKCLIREKHYWDIVNPEYNLAKDPTAPMSGRTHSDATKIQISDALKGENHPMYGKNHTEETKTIMSETHTGEKNPMHNKQKPEGAGRPSQQIEVTDITNNQTTIYDSISEAARALNLTSYRIISNYILRNQKNPYKGVYTFKKV